MNDRPRISKAGAMLGAMSWRLPDDDWTSPWSFENEWIAPKDDPKAAKSPEPEPLPQAASRTNTPLPAAAEATAQGMVLRFDEGDRVEVVPPAKAPTPAVADMRFRPPDVRRVAEEPVKKPLPEPERPYKLEPLPEPAQRFVEAVPATEPNRKRTIPRRATVIPWGSLISLSLGTLGFTLLAWIYLHDSARDSDEDLRPQVAIDQTPTIQAPVKLRAFLDSIVPLENVGLRRQPAWSWDTPSLSLFIRSNGTAMDNLRDLLEDYDWHPHHSDWHREDLSSHAGWSHAGYLLQAHAAYLARRGDEEPAFVAAVDLAELGRRLQDVWAWPGFMRRALDLQTAAGQLLAELLKSTRLDAATLGRFQNEFTQCQPDDELMRQACAAYYIHEKKILLGPASGELLDTMPGGRLHQRPGRLFFKMNETLGLFASAFRDLRDEMTRPPYTRLSVSSPSSRIHLTSPRFYHPNSSGEAYFSERIEPLLRLPEDHSLAQARHGLVRSLFAVRRYLADRRTLPAGLNDLTPAYLPSVPQDPFSGEALHYEAARGLLYSAGVNLIAEGGKPTQPPMDDDREPTVELGIAIAVPVKK